MNNLKTELLEIRKYILKSKTNINLVKWADEHRYLSSEASSTPGKWSTEVVEVARGPMLAASEPGIKKISLMCCTQLLKALCIETPIPTTKGWSKMSEMKIGDKVFDENGKPCNVVGVSDVKNSNKCFRITFSDGTEIICDAGHEWLVDDYENHAGKFTTRIVNTLEMSKRYKFDSNKRNRFAISNSMPIKCRHVRNLPIDPYLLGVWLGDGATYHGQLSLNKADSIHILSRIDESYRIKPDSENCITVKIDGFFRRLRLNNFLKNKHIPDAYLRSGVNQRYALLQGLMDTDGTISKKGSPSITAKSLVLTKQINELIISLGMKPSIKSVIIKINGKKLKYYMTTFTAYKSNNIFSLPRKKERLIGSDDISRRPSETKRRRITKIEKIKSVPVKCIMVDSPSHLYLCSKKMIPTHNSEMILNLIGYFSSQEPCPMLAIMPTKDMAETLSKDRIDNMIKDSPSIKEAFSIKKSRDSENTIYHKKFKGGQLSIVWSNSPAQLSSRPVKVVLCDEIDKYPRSSGREGDPIALAEERSDTFWDSLIVHTCSPTIKGESRIEKEYLASDQRIFEIPCPECGLLFEPLWKHVKWEKRNKKTARIECPGCEHKLTEKDRLIAIRHGSWVATKPFDGHAGFKANKLVSPWQDMPTLVGKWLKAKNNPELLKVFINTQLAETWEEKGERPAWEKLSKRGESNLTLGVCPDNVAVLTCTADIQQDRIEVLTIGWTENMVHFLVDRQMFFGSTATEKPWDDLRSYLAKPLITESGHSLPIALALIDSGYKAKKVYEFCLGYVNSGRVFPIKGFDNLKTVLGTPSAVDIDINGKKIRRGVQLFPIGASVLKGYAYDLFSLIFPSKGNDWPHGFFRFPEMDNDFFKQLTAEQVVKEKDKRGFIKKVWKKIYERNEALDLYCYNWAAAHVLGLHQFQHEQWEQLALQTRQKLNTIKLEDNELRKSKTIKKRKTNENEGFW